MQVRSTSAHLFSAINIRSSSRSRIVYSTPSTTPRSPTRAPGPARMVLPTNTIVGCSTLRPRPRPRLVRILPPARRRLSTPSRKYYCATKKRTHEEKEICLDFQSLTRTRKASFEIWCTLSHACGRDFLTHTNCAGDPHTHPRCSWGDAEALVRPSVGPSRSPPQAELPVCGSAAFQAGQGVRMTRYLHVYMSACLRLYIYIAWKDSMVDLHTWQVLCRRTTLRPQSRQQVWPHGTNVTLTL